MRHHPRNFGSTWRRTAPLLLCSLILVVTSGCAWRGNLSAPRENTLPEDLNLVFRTAGDDLPASAAPDPILDAAAAPLELSRDAALALAFAGNRDLAVRRLGPLAEQEDVAIALAEYDWLIGADATVRRDERVSRFQTVEGLIKTYDASTELGAYGELAMPTGTTLRLSGGLAFLDSSQGGGDINPDFNVRVTQALLEGRDQEVNLVDVALARNEALLSEYELVGYALQLARDMEYGYWDLVLANEVVAIREFSVELARQNLQLSETFEEFGVGLPSNTLNSRAEVANREADLVDALAQQRQREVDLLRLIGASDDASRRDWLREVVPLDPPETVDLNVSIPLSIRAASRMSPLLAQATLERENRELAVMRTKNGLLPRLDAFIELGVSGYDGEFGEAYADIFEDPEVNYAVGLSFEYSPELRAERAARRRAEFRLEAAQRAIANLSELVEVNVVRAAIEVDRQKERIRATQVALEAREEALRVETERFQEGLVTNLDVLLVQRDLIEAQVDEVTARVRYIQALTDLYLAEGTLLLRRGIGLYEEEG